MSASQGLSQMRAVRHLAHGTWYTCISTRSVIPDAHTLRATPVYGPVLGKERLASDLKVSEGYIDLD